MRFPDSLSNFLRPEALAPDGLCCPAHLRLSASSASEEVSAAFPGPAGYSSSLWHSRIILPDLFTFRTFTVVLSRIAAFSFRREPRHLLLSSSVSTLAIG